MSESLARIEVLGEPTASADVERLVELLAATVHTGAAVTFLASAQRSELRDYWLHTLGGTDPRKLVLVARRGEDIVGTVQVQPARANNQHHRAEIAKLMVHPSARNAGLGRALMEAAELGARRAGFRLLTLDTRAGDTAERLYLSLGWTRVGAIPGFALDPDGLTPHDAAIFYKQLEPGPN